MTNTTQARAAKLVESFVRNIDKRDSSRLGPTSDPYEERAERAFDRLSALVGEDEAVRLIESVRP